MLGFGTCSWFIERLLHAEDDRFKILLVHRSRIDNSFDITGRPVVDLIPFLLVLSMQVVNSLIIQHYELSNNVKKNLWSFFFSQPKSDLHSSLSMVSIWHWCILEYWHSASFKSSSKHSMSFVFLVAVWSNHLYNAWK